MSHMTRRTWYFMIMSACIFPRLLVKRVPHNSACLPDCMYLTYPLMSQQLVQLVSWLWKYLQSLFVFDFRCRLWDTQSICGWICPRLQWVFSRPKCKLGCLFYFYFYIQQWPYLEEELIWWSRNIDHHTGNRLWSFFCTERPVLSFDSWFSLSAYLCDQWKWEDEIQDLKKQKTKQGLRKRRRSHTSCNGKPEHFPWDTIHFQQLS